MVATLVAAPAFAQDARSARFERDTAAKDAARTARASMAAGKCDAALDQFDEALRTSVDATIRRDRGLCHEKLGHTHPAMEDFRAYLTEYPDAPDSDGIRERLSALEEASMPETTSSPAASASGASASFRVSAGGRARGGIESSDGRPAATLAQIERDEALDDDADRSPLRRGRGVVLGGYFAPRYWTRASFEWGYAYGLALRYAFPKLSTLTGELGYSRIESQGPTSRLGGFSGSIGYEARIALDPRLSNALLLGVAVGYEHLRQPSTGIVFATVLPRGRAGYRHVFGPSFGLEIAADVGYAFVNALDVDDSGGDALMVGLQSALVLGF